MASPTLEHLRSPFSNVFQILPEGHDKALKHAFYNTAALVFVILAGGAGVAVYFVLEAFIRPLLWAVLCGTVLHPIKNKLTLIVKGWLQNLHASGTPLAVGTILIPVHILDGASEKLGEAIYFHWKTISTFCVGLPVFYLLWHFGPIVKIFNFIYAIFYILYDFVGYFNTLWVVTLVVGYLLLVIFYWNPTSEPVLRTLAVPVWIAFLLQVATWFGPLRVPILFAVVAMTVVGFLTYMKKGQDLSLEELDTSTESLNGDEEVEKSECDENNEKDETQITENYESKREEDTVDNSVVRETTPEPTPTRTKKSRKLSDKCFITLFWALVIVRIWIHFWIINLLPLLFVFLIIKKLGYRIGDWSQIRRHCVYYVDKFTQWAELRKDALAPPPIRAMLHYTKEGDTKVVQILAQSTDKIMTVVLILGVVFGAVFMVLFTTMQVQQESMHLITVTSTALNKTMHPEISSWLPNSADLHKNMDKMVGNAYQYGRDYIASKVKHLVNGGQEEAPEVEKQILELYDKMYETWIKRNDTTKAPVKKPGIDVSNLTSVFSSIKKADVFKYDEIASFVHENIGTFQTVLESIWLVLKGNINLVMSILQATISIILGSGTTILNFLLSYIVFLTTLFYLLALSGEQYKPMEWIMAMAPGGETPGGSSFGKSVERAISGVFIASLKMGSFYGLYTWLTHTVFGLQIVFIPSVLATVLGVIPFVGTYWAAIPGMLELLVYGHKFQAVLLFIAHIMPMMVVDTAIYSDIKGGAHPYMTGLAIAGGMYCLGFEGAIIGPILLCCLAVIANYYGYMLKSTNPDIPGPHRRATTGMGPSDEQRVSFDLQRVIHRKLKNQLSLET